MRKLSDYEVISVLGSGSLGTCFKVRHKGSGEIFAWKAVDHEIWTNSFREEFELLLSLDHKNIIRHRDYFVNEGTQTVYIVMEFCSGGNLSELMSQCKDKKSCLSEEFIWRTLYQICRALHVCHMKLAHCSYLNCDIKPTNVLTDCEGNAKLDYFGLSKDSSRELPHSVGFVEISDYISLEEVKSTKYTRKSHIWHLGCLIYEMCTLQPRLLEELHFPVTSSEDRVRIPECYSNDLQEIISFMLRNKSKAGATIDIVLRHPLLARHVPKACISSLPFVECDHCPVGFAEDCDFSSTLVKEDFDGMPTSMVHSKLFDSRRKLTTTSNPDLSTCIADKEDSKLTTEPSIITQNVFNQALVARLHAIRVRETLLEQKAVELAERENNLNERLKRIDAKEKSLDSLLRHSLRRRSRRKRSSVLQNYDDADSTILPNDTLVIPTVAKIDFTTLHRPRSLAHRVTFKSPGKQLKDSENCEPDRRKVLSVKEDRTDRQHETKCRKLKSMLGLFTHKKIDSQANVGKQSKTVETQEIEKKWTTENKRAAFKILAEMNDAKKHGLNHHDGTCSISSRKTRRSDILL